MSLVCQGRRNKEIAASLFVSEETVKIEWLLSNASNWIPFWRISDASQLCPLK